MSESNAGVNWNRMLRHLNQAELYWLNTTHHQGRPHNTATNGVWQHVESDGSLLFFFLADPDSQSAANLEIVPFTLLNIPGEEMTVTVEGTSRLLTPAEAEELAHITNRYEEKYDRQLFPTADQTSSGLTPVFFRFEGARAKVWEFYGDTKGEANPQTIQLPYLGEEAVAPEVPGVSGDPTNQPDPPKSPEHPGSPYDYPYPNVHEDTWELWHENEFFSWQTKVHLFAPRTGQVPPGGFGVLVVSPGFELGSAGYYRRYLEHVAHKGYIALFVVTQAWLLDSDHARQAGELLEAVKEALDHRFRPGEVDYNRVGWWAHSIGCKVQGLAAAMTDHPAYIRPTFVIGSAFSNQKVFYPSDAIKTAPNIPAEVAYSLMPGNEDKIAKTQESLELYDAMPQVTRRQVIQVSGYGEDALITDHAAPMSDGKIPVIGEKGQVNALDWYGYWKWAVGALEYHFARDEAARQAAEKWIYGGERLNGGTDKTGYTIEHTQLKQSWN